MDIYPAKVDLSSISSGVGGNIEWAELAEDFGTSLHRMGIVYLVDHGIDSAVIEKLFSNSKDLFNLPIEMKKKYSKVNAVEADNFNGFSAAGDEILSNDPNSSYEVKESFDITITKPKYPDVVPEFQKTVKEFVVAVENLKETVFKLLAISLKIDEDFFRKSGNYLDGISNYTALRILRYPRVPESFKITKGTIRCAEHFDWDIITFLFQDSVGGLEARTRDGTWIHVPPMPGSIILVAGEILETWTRGYFPAVCHRILLTEEDERIRRDRYSFGYFIFPDNDFVVEPLGKTEVLNDDWKFSPRTTRCLIQNHVIQSRAN